MKTKTKLTNNKYHLLNIISVSCFGSPKFIFKASSQKPMYKWQSVCKSVHSSQLIRAHVWCVSPWYGNTAWGRNQCRWKTVFPVALNIPYQVWFGLVVLAAQVAQISMYVGREFTFCNVPWCLKFTNSKSKRTTDITWNIRSSAKPSTQTNSNTYLCKTKTAPSNLCSLASYD